MTDIVTLAAQLRQRMISHDEAALNRVIAMYAQMWERIQDRADLLGVEIADLANVTPATIRKLERYQELMQQIERELDRFSGWLGAELPVSARGMIDLAGGDAAVLMRGFGVTGTFNMLPARAIETLLGFLDPDGPLYDRLSKLPGYVVDRVSRALLEGLTLGKNPRTIARELVRDKLGLGLTDALRMTRTVNLWSYREASRANYQANSDVVTGWQWYAELDGDTCASCIAQHGSIHPLDEPLDDHYNGRCTMLPVLIGLDPALESGQAWFEKQSEQQQREILGSGRYDAWKEGRFEFSALSKQTNDEVYGTMRTEATLEDLIGPIEK